MKPSTFRRPFVAILVAVAFLALAASVPVFAHTATTIGPYDVEIGWVEEPPVVGQKNAIVIEVSEGGQPVSGVEAALDSEIGYGGRTMRANLNPTDEPGVYTIPFIPTVRGQYSVRLFGSIGETAVDQTLDPEEVGDGAMLAFPEPLADTRAMQEQIDSLAAEAQSARTIAFVALGVAAIGLALGALALVRRGKNA